MEWLYTINDMEWLYTNMCEWGGGGDGGGGERERERPNIAELRAEQTGSL